MNTEMDDDLDETGSADLDPRVRKYFDDMLARGTRAVSPEYQSQLAGSRTADADASIGRAQLAGISEGLSKLGTLHGKSPDVKPLTTTLGGIDQTQQQRAGGMAADQADAEKRMGMNAKVYEYLQGRADKTNEAQLNRQSRADLATQAQLASAQRDAQHMKELAAIKAAGAQTTIINAGAKTNSKHEELLDKDEQELSKRIEGSTRNEIGSKRMKLDAAESLETLLDAHPDGNIPPQFMSEVAMGMANMLSPGQVTEAQIRALDPQSLQRKVAEWGQQLTGSPQGANMPGFVKLYRESLAREKAAAVDQVNRAVGRHGTGFTRLQKGRPESYYRILGLDENDFDDKGRYKMRSIRDSFAKPDAAGAPAAPAAVPPPAGGPGTAIAAPAPAAPKDGDVKKTPDGRMFTRIGGQWIEHPAAGAP